VCGLTLALGPAAGWLIFSFRSTLPLPSQAQAEAAAVASTPAASATASSTFPSDKEMAANWPRFRGYDGSGISPLKDIPTSWDAAAGKNIVWKTPVPLPGHNSPVVWGERVFLSGATEKARQVF